MTQYALPTIDPEVTTGTDLATYLNSWRPAVLSSHAGAARPSYAVAGQLWVEQVSASVWNLKLFCGAVDGIVGTVNPTTGVFAIGGAGAFSTLTTSGNTTLGDASGDTLTVNATATFASGVTLTGADLVVSRSSAGGTVLVDAFNSNNANAASDAALRARVGGASGGDPRIELLVTGIQAWSIGIDNSDSDKLKIGSNAAVGTATKLTIDAGTGVVTLNAGDLNVIRSQAGGDVVALIWNTETANPASRARFHARVDGGSSGDAALQLEVNGQVNWWVGVDNSDSDKFKINQGVGVGSSNMFELTASGVSAFHNVMYINGSGTGQALNILDTTNAAGAQIALNGNGATTPNKFIRSCLGLFEIVRSDYGQVILMLNDSGSLHLSNTGAATGFTVAGSIVHPLGAGIKSRSAFSAWVRFNNAGTITRALNVTSVTKNSTGNYTLNIAAGVMADGNYGYWMSGTQVAGPAGLAIYVDTATTPTATALRIQTIALPSSAAADPVGDICVGIVP